MAHFEDYELAQTIHRELVELRARAKSATSVELSVVAAKAELPTNWQPQESREAVDDARTNAWLAICRLVEETGNNETAAEENRPDKMINTDPLWAVAIDRLQDWVIEAA
jgi:hypothetical protein